MPGLWDRLSDMLGWTPPEEDDWEEHWEEDEAEESDIWARTELAAASSGESEGWGRKSGREKARIVSLPGRSSEVRSMELAVAEPASFDEVQLIADQLKKDVGVVVNVEQLDRGEARRVVDFLSGTVYALNGEMQQVSAHVVMFVPQQARIQRVRDARRTKSSRSGTTDGKDTEAEEERW